MKKLLFIGFLWHAQLLAQNFPIPVSAGDTFHVKPWPQTIPPDHLDRMFPVHVASIVLTVDSALYQKYRYHWILYYDFYTTLTGFHFMNSKNAGDVNNIYFYYNIDIKNNIEVLGLKWDLYVFNDYGFRYFFDSISNKTQDQLTLKNSLYFPLVSQKLFLSVSAATQTKLWNTHQYRTNDQGNREKYLYDGFMSPGTVLYSGGFTLQTPGNITLQLGLGSSKICRIRNPEIFESRQEQIIEGIKKGQRKKSEFGLSLTLTVPMQKIGPVIRWEFFGNSFAPANHLKDIKYYTFDVNNVFHLLLLKYVRLSWRTKLSHNYDANTKPFVQNQFSLGFYLNNFL